MIAVWSAHSTKQAAHRARRAAISAQKRWDDLVLRQCNIEVFPPASEVYRIEQDGAPAELYNRPATAFTAPAVHPAALRARSSSKVMHRS